MLGIVNLVLSRHIESLELDFGGRLFNRTGRGVELSDLGRLLLPARLSLLEQADQLSADANAATGRVSGEVRIGMLASFANPLAVQLLIRAKEEYPDVRIKIFEGTIGRIDEWLEEGRIDLSVNFRDSQAALGDEQKIGMVGTYVVGPADDPLLADPRIEFKRLNGLR